MIVKYTNKQVSIKNIYDFKCVSNAIKTHLKRHGVDLYKVLEQEGITVPSCSFCDKHNTRFFLICSNNENYWKIDDIDLSYGGTTKSIFFCWDNKNCPGKKLNGNSVEFVSRTQGISEEEARLAIHKRNKSPFYKENHSSMKEYALSQSKYSSNSKTDMKHILSDSGYQNRYGDQWLEIKQKHNSSKAITIENMIKRYGEEEGTRRYREWIKSTSVDLESFIIKYGKVQGSLKYMSMISKKEKQSPISSYDDFIRYCYFVITRNFYYKLSSYPIRKKLLDKKSISAGITLFDTDVDSIIDDLKSIDPEIMKYDLKESYRSVYGYAWFTFDGRLLRSSYETDFYLRLIGAGLKDSDFYIDKNYPNSNMRYDFYFHKLGLYIEIAGLAGNAEYDKGIDLKKKQFNPLIISPEEIPETIEMIKGKI